MSTPLIYLATPAYGGLVTTSYMLSIVRLIGAAPELGFDTTLNLLGKDSLVTRSRNTLVAHFLSIADATHMMFIDADIGFAPEQVARMLALDEDVVAGMYPLKTFRWDQAETVGAGEPLETGLLHYVGQFCERSEIEMRDGFEIGRAHV